MGSDIEVQSQVNEGSCFAFTLQLPLVSSHNNTLAGIQQQPSLPALPEVSVLVVEDNEINRYVLCQFLQQWQISYDIAESGEAALQLIEKNTYYHLIFMDLQMPDLDGYETSQQIRSMETEYHQNVPIVALTAAMISDSLQKLNDCGINDYLGKPFEPAQLHQTIETWSKHLITANIMRDTSTLFHIVINFEKMFSTCKGVSEEMLKCVDLYLKYFEELKNDFGRAVQKNEEKKLSNWAHNLKPIMAIAGIDDQEFLRNQIAQVRQAMKQEPVPTQEITQGVEHVTGYCAYLLQLLQEKKQAIKTQ
jgi:CheY-like chemotaxis protein